jgi:hypothetical protein
MLKLCLFLVTLSQEIDGCRAVSRLHPPLCYSSCAETYRVGTKDRSATSSVFKVIMTDPGDMEHRRYSLLLRYVFALGLIGLPA